MTDNDPRPGAAPIRNPYTPTAVALVTETGAEPVTVPTVAVHRARDLLDSYLDAYDGGVEQGPDAEPTLPPAGNVVAFIGDYGTGKTHLANYLMAQLRRRKIDTAHALYVEASRGASFLSLYQDFFRQLRTRHDVRARVSEYYADVVADWLRSSPLYSPLAVQLQDGHTTVSRIAERIGLTEASMLAELRTRLERVTRHEDFAAAFALMVRPGFEDDVEAWLGGASPPPSLRDRGIDRRIDSDDAALEAIGVFALLYGHRHHRFMLVIDEIEKLVDGPDAAGTTTGFKHLLEVFASARGFLVVAGLPHVVQSIGEPTMQRFGHVVPMPPLDANDVTRLVAASHERFLQRDTLDPFTPDGIGYLTRLANGVPRQIIRLLHDSFRVATNSGRQVTPDLIREIAPEFAAATRDEVTTLIRAVATRETLRAHLDVRLSTAERTQVDIWVWAPASPAAGIAFFVADSVLTAEDAGRLVARARAVRSQRPEALTRLVVAGWVSPELDAPLTEGFGAAPLLYQPHAAFSETLAADLRALRAMSSAVGSSNAPGGDTTPDRLDQIRWNQDDIREVVRQLAATVDRMRGSSERRLAAMQGQLGGLWTELTAVGALPQAGPLPPEVQNRFDEVERAFAEAFRLRSAFDTAFELTRRAHPNPTPAAQDAARRLRSVFAAPSNTETVGTLTLLHTLVLSFREAVTGWHLRFHAATSPERSQQADDALEQLCRTYDDIFDDLPQRLHRGLEQLAPIWTVPFHGVAWMAPFPETDEDAGAARGDLMNLLRDLGAAVLREARRPAD